MFGIGSTEFIAIAIVLLIVVGPRHLPELLHRGARLMAQLRMASRELQDQITNELEDLQNTGNEIRQELTDGVKQLQEEVALTDDAMKEIQATVQKTQDEIDRELRDSKTAAVVSSEEESTKPSTDEGSDGGSA